MGLGNLNLLKQLKEVRTEWQGTSGQYFVVFSDIHVSTKLESQRYRGNDLIVNIKEDWELRLKKYFDHDEFSGILLVGDLTFSGTNDEFKLFDELYINPLTNIFNLKKDKIFSVPGNHDQVRRFLAPFWNRIDKKHPCNITEHYARQKFASNDNNIWNDTNKDRFKNYEEWHRRVACANNKKGMIAGPWSYVQRNKNLDIKIAGLNSAIASTSQYPPGYLKFLVNLLRKIKGRKKDHWINTAQVYESLGNNRGNIRTLTLMHHSPNDLDEIDKTTIRALNKLTDAIIHGHHHILEAKDKTEITPITICAPSFGNPMVGRKSIKDINHRDSYLIIRFSDDNIQIFYRSNQPPTSIHDFKFTGKHDPNLKPDHTFKIGSKI